MKAYETRSPQETRALAASFAKNLAGNEVILLYGNLGAGKTEFMKGLVNSLAAGQKVASPTYPLHKIYGTKKFPVHHFDFYRLHKKTNIKNIGLYEALSEEKKIIAIEWPEKIMGIKELISGKFITITFQHGKKENLRKIKITR